MLPACRSDRQTAGNLPVEEPVMAKAQKKSNKETRKPKAEKAKKTNVSNPSTKGGTSGLVTLKS
ncbi:hypothetical protein D3Y57_11090 [Sphingomonas paeninsulae]|uniref:Uncharacterized protein n=1 Tax=Sphingomonas paeninsulae TaxID=2319844 RepID=A0A494TKR8_SPHPE|nr:hypothetical protein D3Y57_11090 [Sphingomonas paeninsulae]